MKKKQYKREPSILWYEDRCACCGSRGYLQSHEVFFGTSNRKKSCEDGCWLKLCQPCHLGIDGPHRNRARDLELKQMAQYKWMEFYNKTEDDFRARYGKSYFSVQECETLEEDA